jgi:hypothetical protein
VEKNRDIRAAYKGRGARDLHGIHKQALCFLILDGVFSARKLNLR